MLNLVNELVNDTERIQHFRLLFRIAGGETAVKYVCERTTFRSAGFRRGSDWRDGLVDYHPMPPDHSLSFTSNIIPALVPPSILPRYVNST